MKNLKVLICLSAIALFSTLNLIAQPDKKIYIERTFPVLEGQAYCGSEKVDGTVTYQWKITVPGQWYQLKVFYSLIGRESGCHYEAQAVFNVHYKIPPSGVEIENITTHFMVKKDNIPVGFSHENFHSTVSAGGEIIVERDNYFEECF